MNLSPIHNFYHAQLTGAAIAAADSYTVLLAHFDGTQGSTTFTDSSTYTHALTANGSAHISTTQSKFGGSSLKLDGTGDYVTSPDSADWFLGTGSFTIDWWGYQGTTTNQVVFGQYVNGTNWWGAVVSPVPNTSNACLTIGGLNAGSWDINISCTSSTAGNPTNTWNHYAIVRIDSGNSSASWRFFINGVSKTLSLNVGAWNGQLRNYTGSAYIGTLMGNFAADYNGYIDELRVSKGIARWTSDFTPPTSAY